MVMDLIFGDKTMINLNSYNQSVDEIKEQLSALNEICYALNIVKQTELSDELFDIQLTINKSINEIEDNIKGKTK